MTNRYMLPDGRQWTIPPVMWCGHCQADRPHNGPYCRSCGTDNEENTVSKSRAAGTRWETAITSYLHTRGWVYAERRALRGANDRGDIAGIPGVCIEAKSAKRIELAAWLDEAKAETANDHADVGVVWFKRRMRTNAGDGFVLMDGDTFTRLLTHAGYGGDT